MRNYKDENDNLYGLEDHVTPPENYILITVAERDAIIEANKPPLSNLQIRNAALADISYTRPSDGAEIQVRHPDYASDYLMMKEARDNMGSGDVEGWIDINNNPITMTKQDFADAMSHNRSEIKVIFATYIAKL